MPRSNRPRRSGRPLRRAEGTDDEAGEGQVGQRGQGARGGQRPLLGGQRQEQGADGTWHVRPVPGAAARKEYRCPGCQQVIAPGTPHVLAWPSTSGEAVGGLGLLDAQDAVAARRHWHRACWSRRTRLPAR